MLNIFRKTLFSKSLANTAKAAYHENVIDYFEKPRNVGSLDKNDKNVGTGFFTHQIKHFLSNDI